MNQISGAKSRLVVGLIIAAISFFTYLTSQEFNPVTGENQHVSLTYEQEIALGQQSISQIISEYGGLSDNAAQQRINAIGSRLVRESIANDSPWEFEFYVLNDDQTINAFALPGGPVFITTGLLNRLATDDEVAGVLSHEIVHVLARHSAQRIAQSELTNGLVGAVGAASGDANAAQTAAVVAQLINMKYGRDDELQSDTIGICLMIDAGYNPEGMIEVMRVLEAASGGQSQPEFFSTHPNPANRINEIEGAIQNADQDCR
jgi:predicted Zn-dependent protease